MREFYSPKMRNFARHGDGKSLPSFHRAQPPRVKTSTRWQFVHHLDYIPFVRGRGDGTTIVVSADVSLNHVPRAHVDSERVGESVNCKFTAHCDKDIRRLAVTERGAIGPVIGIHNVSLSKSRSVFSFLIVKQFILGGNSSTKKFKKQFYYSY